MTAFLAIGVAGVVLLVVALLLGDIIDGVVEGLGGGGLFSTEALAGFVGALGFGGAIALEVTGSTTVAVAVGIAVGLALGWLAGWLSKKLHDDADSGATSTTQLVEKIATVISDVPADGYGVVTVSSGGHITRLNARSSVPLAAGTEVSIVGVISPTAVQVEPLFLP